MSAPVDLEYKNVASPDALPADAGSTHEGVIEALVAVTGVKDDVGDVIVPGAFRNTLDMRKPKVCLGHDWNRPIGKTLQIKELMPGDPALPKTTADGKPWPREAGAVWAQFQVNMDVDDGKNAFHSAKFYGPESTYSIGYKATTAKHKAGTRYIHELDLFEFGPVLHPANRLATLQSIKSGEPDGVEYSDVEADEEKGVEIEELTLRDYSAILDIMEQKVAKIRRVADADYWGLPVGTIIRPGMKPRGKGAKGSTNTNRGLTSRKPADAKVRAPKVGSYAVTRDGYAGEITAIDGDKVKIYKAGESAKTFNLRDVAVGEATDDTPIDLQPTAAMQQAAANVFDGDSGYSPEELGAFYRNGVLTITDIGRAIDSVDNELDIMEENPERKKSAGASTRALRKKLVSLVEFEGDDEQGDGEPGSESTPEAETPTEEPSAPAEDLATIEKVGEELGMEVRANPWPPEYIVKEPKGARGYGGRVMSFSSDTGQATTNNAMKIPAGRAEEYMRTWMRLWEASKDGYTPRSEEVLAEMDRPAREAAAKAETEQKKREVLANATNEELAGQAEFEVNRLVRLDARWEEARAEGRATDPQGTARARAYGLANLELVNAELVKRGLPAYELPGPKLSTKPTGGRPIREILDSIPETKEGQAARWSISNGADVIDEPGGSGVFAIAPLPAEGGKTARGQWVITVGSGLSIPASPMVRAQSNESGIDVSTPKKVTAWLKAMGALRDADGNPPPYGAATGPELLAWRDSEGRTLRDALTDVVVPAYLKAIGKKGEVTDKSTPAKWRNAPLVAAQQLPTEMYNDFVGLSQNAKQAYILGRTEGDDHATALQRARDVIANAQRASDAAREEGSRLGNSPRARIGNLPTGPSYAPVNREERIQGAMRDAAAAYEADQNRVTPAPADDRPQPTPEGEISTDRLLALDRITGPAAVSAMSVAELERHDAELSRRAAALGKPGVTSPAHQAVKNALLRKRLDARQEAADRARAERVASETPDQRRARRMEEAPSTEADARRSGRQTRGEIALREANAELPLDNFSGNAYNLLRIPGGVEGAREDAATSVELARGITPDAEFLARADIAERTADIIDSWGLDLGADSELPDKMRAWAAAVRTALTNSPVMGDPEIARFQRELAEQPDDLTQARRANVPTRGALAFRLAQQRLGMDTNPIGYALLDSSLTPEQMREEARVRASNGFGNFYGVQQVEAALNEIDTWGVDFGKDQALLDNTRAWVEGMRAGRAEYETPAPAPTTPPAANGIGMEDGRSLRIATPRKDEEQAYELNSGDLTLRVYKLRRSSERDKPWAYDVVDSTTGDTVVEGQGLYRSPGSALVRAESEFQEAERRKVSPAEQTATITPELLDAAVESEAASVGLSETPDGDLEVDEDVAQRQVRVEKLIKDVDAGTVKLSEQSTEDLTATRRDLVDELRLQTAIARRAPRPARPATAQAPKVRPGLAGAAEDHAEALRSGDAEAIARTRARLESSIRRSRTDSDVARSLADTVTSPDDNDADQLSDLAKRLRAESRERRNASARKRRTAKRIERDRLRSLLGEVDTELRSRGVEPEPVSPQLLEGDTEEGDLTPDQKIENDIYSAYKELAAEPGDWVRIARIAKKVDATPADWARVMRTATRRQDGVQLAPESNTKVLKPEDRAAAVRLGSEDLHLISFEEDYAPPRG